MESFQNKIRSIRESKGLSQNQIADLMGISQSAYARFEREATKIDLNRLDLFGSSVGLNLIDILTYPEKWVNMKDVSINQINPEPSTKVLIQLEVDAKEVVNLNLKERLLTILNK